MNDANNQLITGRFFVNDKVVTLATRFASLEIAAL